MTRQSMYSPEVRARAVRMVLEHRGEHASERATIGSIASKIGCKAETLRLWARQTQRDQGRCAGPTTEQRTRLRDLEREVRELRQANEILRKASAYLAMAELDRRSKPSAATPSIRFREEAGASGRQQGLHSSTITAAFMGPSDLPAAADRPLDVLRARRSAARSFEAAGPYPAECRAVR